MSRLPVQASRVSDDYYFNPQAGHLLRHAYRRHIAIFRHAITDFQLTTAQFVTLCAVRDQQDASINDSAKITANNQQQ
ncbi:hypothetical protein [Caballeronia sp. S22]|uniref:hypothetical protein n=1 Tax=Caballeronia sp. S22 TaxID=3137182 RepID=UPI003530D4A0